MAVAGINSPGDVLSLRTSALGTFALLPVATDLLFTRGLTTALLLGLPVTPNNALGLSHD